MNRTGAVTVGNKVKIERYRLFSENNKLIVRYIIEKSVKALRGAEPLSAMAKVGNALDGTACEGKSANLTQTRRKSKLLDITALKSVFIDIEQFIAEFNALNPRFHKSFRKDRAYLRQYNVGELITQPESTFADDLYVFKINVRKRKAIRKRIGTDLGYSSERNALK